MSKHFKILVVEDEADIRDLMILHLKRDGMDVTGAEDGEQALKLLEKNEFDLVILDWMLPGVSGLDLCKKLAGKMPILMVTARADVTDVVLGLEMGADDYITKPFEIPVLFARVRALLRRAYLIRTEGGEEPATYEVGALRLDVEKHEVLCGGEKVPLTTSEFKLLLGLLKNRGKVLPREKLIEIVQGQGITVTDRSVDTHVFGLRKKLGTCADVVETIRGVGYRVKAE